MGHGLHQAVKLTPRHDTCGKIQPLYISVQYDEQRWFWGTRCIALYRTYDTRNLYVQTSTGP
jgi:hypothetical protein